MMFVGFANMQISITANIIFKAEVLMHSCAIIAQQYVNLAEHLWHANVSFLMERLQFWHFISAKKSHGEWFLVRNTLPAACEILLIRPLIAFYLHLTTSSLMFCIFNCNDSHTYFSISEHLYLDLRHIYIISLHFHVVKWFPNANNKRLF